MGKFLRLVNGRAKMFDESSSLTIYDETTHIGSTITSGTAITLPLSQTYTSLELEIYLNGQRLEDTLDYTFVGSAPRTQVSLTFDLTAGDDLRFRIDRSP